MVLMVWFLPVTRPTGEGRQRGRGWVLFFNLPPPLPNTLIYEEKKIHLAQGAVKTGNKSENGPFDHALPHPLSPTLLQTEAQTPPHLTSAWSLAKEMELGENTKVGTVEISLPSTLPPTIK